MKTMPCFLLKRFCLALLVAICFAFDSFAQSNANPCGAKPEYRQFDFWIGEWEVTANGNRAGENSVQLILGKCVIFENWTGARGMSGKSFNVYNAAKGKWQQTWVDSQGNVLELHGEFKDGAMRLAGEVVRNNQKTLHKLTFFPLEGGRVRQLWESSQDDGKTWSTVFDGLYIRKKSAAAESK
jgi:hypothetical protein